MRRALFALAVVPLLLAGFAFAGEAEIKAAQTTIDSQLKAFLADDGAAAYSYAAPNIRELFPTADIFMGMVTNGYAPVQPIVSPHGSSDAFYIKIDKHYGASDHVTYMQFGIPAVMFITWPDMWYHSSEDTPDKQDPTQYKRAAVVGTGALAVLATGTDEIAARVLSENVGRGLSRMGEAHVKALSYLADARDPASLGQAYREAIVAVNHQTGVEKKVIESASILWTNAAAGKQKTSTFVPLIDQRATALINEVKAAYQLQATQRGAPATIPPRVRCISQPI